MTGYAPLSSEPRDNDPESAIPKLLEHPIVTEVAKKYKKSPAQILLRHGIQGGLVVIPKSSNAQRRKDNIDIFDFKLNEYDVNKLDTLDLGEKGRVYDYSFLPG